MRAHKQQELSNRSKLKPVLKIICTYRTMHFTCQNATHLRNLWCRLIKTAIHTYVRTYHLLTRTFLRKPSSSLYCLAVRTQPPGSGITSGKVRAGNCSGTDNPSSVMAGIPSVLPSLARNSSSQSNAEIKSDSEFTSSFQLKSAQPAVDFYDLHLKTVCCNDNHLESRETEISVSRVCNNLSSIPTRRNVIQYSLLLSMLYMFHADFPPNIRNSKTVHTASGLCQACCCYC